ncbi:Collectin-12 [Holothuria leucospilota]|uniref:Collectin-12 n=1 Tax=Holothuria leucospilota TaxID=206669 RepID=A0A9Q1C879_HOLLE|nr:Collectin-12 [Holothuria leucospilota]
MNLSEHQTSEEGMMSSQERPTSPLSDKTTKDGGQDTTIDSSPRLSTKPVTENRAYKKVMTSPLEQPLSNSSDVSTIHDDHDTTSAASSPGFSTEFAKVIHFSFTLSQKDVPQWYHWNDSFYTFVSTNKRTWEDAAKACSSRREGAHLVFIKSELENKEVSRLSKVASKGLEKRWWIGLTDKDTEGVWKWYDVSLTYANWHRNQPDNAGKNEDCGELGFRWSGENAFWNDARCTRQKKFICESGFGNDL